MDVYIIITYHDVCVESTYIYIYIQYPSHNRLTMLTFAFPSRILNSFDSPWFLNVELPGGTPTTSASSKHSRMPKRPARMLRRPVLSQAWQGRRFLPDPKHHQRGVSGGFVLSFLKSHRFWHPKGTYSVLFGRLEMIVNHVPLTGMISARTIYNQMKKI